MRYEKNCSLNINYYICTIESVGTFKKHFIKKSFKTGSPTHQDFKWLFLLKIIMSTKNFLNVGTTLYNKTNGKTWIIFYCEFNTTLKDWEYIMVLADNPNFVVLGSDKKISGSYIFKRIEEEKLIKNINGIKD